MRWVGLGRWGLQGKKQEGVLSEKVRHSKKLLLWRAGARRTSLPGPPGGSGVASDAPPSLPGSDVRLLLCWSLDESRADSLFVWCGLVRAQTTADEPVHCPASRQAPVGAGARTQRGHVREDVREGRECTNTSLREREHARAPHTGTTRRAACRCQSAPDARNIAAPAFTRPSRHCLMGRARGWPQGNSDTESWGLAVFVPRLRRGRRAS